MSDIKPDDVPESVVEAGLAAALTQGMPIWFTDDDRGLTEEEYREHFNTAILAALNAWPRAEKSRDEDRPCIILPLEKRNDT